MKSSKLVRDTIPSLMFQKNNEQPITHIADSDEFYEKLKEKLVEETQEYLQALDHKQCVGELADILEVIYTLARHHHVTRKELEVVRQEKANRNGGFKKGIILERII